jgi:hypothetical protein
MSPSDIKRAATTTFLAAPLAFGSGCIETGLQPPLPPWDNPAPRPIEDVTQTDEIMQVTSPRVDILWMIDNSGSMSDEQNDLTENFPMFMDFFVGSGLDYHIGVTSSDLDGNYNGSNGKLVVVAGTKYIDPDIANPIEMFTAMASLGTSGSPTEQGTGAVFRALEVERDRANAGFWRDEAAVHTIVISDEPDLTRAGIIERNEFVGWYSGLKEKPGDRTFSSIVDPLIGSKYKGITQEIGGIYWSVLDDEWTQVLERLGVQAAGLKREYFLSRLPVEDTIVVKVEDVGGATLSFERGEIDPVTGLASGDFTYDANRNSIVFVEYVPNALSTIVIEYTVLASLQTEVQITEPVQ